MGLHERLLYETFFRVEWNMEISTGLDILYYHSGTEANATKDHYVQRQHDLATDPTLQLKSMNILHL